MFEADSDNAVRPNTLLAEQTGESVSLSIELRIGELLIFELDGNSSGGLLRLSFGESV